MTPLALTHDSLAPESLQEQYSQGDCHHLAVALHRHLGWELVLVLNPDEPYWEDEEDDENFIASVTHVYAVDPQHRAWDVFGCRPAGQMVPECKDRFGGWNLGSDWVGPESELSTYVGCWGAPEAIERPLGEFTEADVATAWAHAQGIFAGIPAWEQALVPSAPSMSRGPRP